MDFLYNSHGYIIDVVPSAAVNAGDAFQVFADFYGIAPRSIAKDTSGAVVVQGVFTGVASEAIAKGDVVYLANGKLTSTPASGTKIGVALDAATASGDKIRFVINAGASEYTEPSAS